MRVRTRSACVVLAWGILLLLTAIGSPGALRAAQATTRTASTTSNTSSRTTTTTIRATLTSSVTTTPGIAPAAPAGRPDATAATATIGRPAARPAARPDTGHRAAAATRAAAGERSYVVQPGDTLTGIAAALGIAGGWPALYAANRRAVGPDPGLIRPGAVLALPGRSAPARYAIAAGDTLSGIAAALAVPGGWPALYAANRRAIGPDPDAIRAGTVLAIPRATASRSSASRASRPAPPASHSPSTPASARASGQAPSSTGGQRRPRSAPALPTGGLPRWLEIVLLAAGLLIATAFLTEPALAIARRRRTARPTAAAADANIVLADYERLVVTHSRHDGTVYVLRPPGADPHAILLAARLVLAQDRYEELAGHLGLPAHWPAE
jgi:LysM domain